MGHSVSKFRSLPLTSYAANPLAIVDASYCHCDSPSPANPHAAITKLHIRQSGAVALVPALSHIADSTLTVTDDHGAVVFHLDGPPHLLLPHHHLNLTHLRHDLPSPSTARAPASPGRPADLHMTNVYGEEILHIHAEPNSSPPSPSSEALPHLHSSEGDDERDAHSLAASGRSSSQASIASFSHHAPTLKLDALATFPVFSIHRPASAVVPPSPMWDRTSVNSLDAVLLSCGDAPSTSGEGNFLALPPSTLPAPPSSSASATTSTDNSTAQTHWLAALWTHDPTLCMHVEATKLNLHSHSVTLAVSCPRNGTLFVKAATDAPVTFIFSGHPSHGGLLVARAYRMPPTAADLTRSSSFSGSPLPSSAASAVPSRHATPSPTRSASLSRKHGAGSPAPAPPSTSKQGKPPSTLSRSADLCTVDVAPGVDQAGIVALCVIAEALRAHLLATHVAQHHGDTSSSASAAFFTHASMKRKPSGASDTSRRSSSLRGGASHTPPPPLSQASPRIGIGAGSLLRPTALTRSNSAPFDSLAGVLGDPPVLSTSTPPPKLDCGPGLHVSPMVARLKSEELGTASSARERQREGSDEVHEMSPNHRPVIGARRSSNPGPIRWATEMFRHREKKKREEQDKDEHRQDAPSGADLAGVDANLKSSASLLSAGS